MDEEKLHDLLLKGLVIFIILGLSVSVFFVIRSIRNWNGPPEVTAKPTPNLDDYTYVEKNFFPFFNISL